MQKVDVIVIGGGAAGLFCAIEAGKRGRKTIVLEHNETVGKKIAISGGGRCNFTNIDAAPDNYISANPHFCKSALARYTAQDFVRLVEKHNIRYHEKKLGQLFCDDSSAQIIGMLEEECRRANVKVHCRHAVLGVRKEDDFKIETTRGSFSSKSLVVATGGLSIAPLGATDFGYKLARQFGLRIEQTRPALVPFTLADETRQQFVELSGIAFDSTMRFGDREFRENTLITHRGLSGPAALQISSYWKPNESISINLLPDADAAEMLRDANESGAEVATLLAKHLPRRFAQKWSELHGATKPIKRYTSKELSTFASQINDWRIVPSGTEGYKKAEVTAGGVATAELSSTTLEAKRVPGLYFVGEVVDVTGQLGGYNFQWAWSSGYAAGQSV